MGKHRFRHGRSKIRPVKSSFVKIPFKSILVIGMSDSGGFLDNLKNKLTDAINKITGGSSDADANADAGATPTPADPTPPTEPSVIDKYLSYIPDEVRYYLTIAIKVIIPLLFATIVANEMIIYKPSVRLFYFILTWILCFAFTSFRWIIVIYYLLRLAFNKYKKGEGASGGFFPTIYALLPWSTDIDTYRPFRYLTLDIGTTPMTEAFADPSFQKKLKNVYYLGEKMVDYFNVLQSADPYRGYGDIYDKNFATVQKLLFEMHMPALEIDHIQKQYIIELRRSNEENEGNEKDVKEIVEYIQIGEHSIPPPVEKKLPLKDRKQPLYMATYDKYTNSFTLKQDNDAFQKDAAKMKKKEEMKVKKEAEEQAAKNAEDQSKKEANNEREQKLLKDSAEKKAKEKAKNPSTSGNLNGIEMTSSPSERQGLLNGNNSESNE